MNKLKKGNFILFNEENPCRILQISKSKPGKHGSAKYNLMGKCLLTGKKCNMLCTGHDVPHYVDTSVRTLYCSYIDDGYAITIDDMGNENNFKITSNELLEKAEQFCEDCDIVVMDVNYVVDSEDYKHTIVTDIRKHKDN